MPAKRKLHFIRDNKLGMSAFDQDIFGDKRALIGEWDTNLVLLARV
jgi:hypothetical protein